MLNSLTALRFQGYRHLASDATLRMIEQAIASGKAAAGIASPSRVFENIGELMGRGLALGIVDQARSAVDAARQVTDAAMSGVQPNAQAAAFANAGATLGQSLAEGIRSEVASVVEATRMLADEATAAAMVRMEEVRREAAALTGTPGTTTATAAAPASVQAAATPTVGGRTVILREGAIQAPIQISGADIKDPEDFARRAGPVLISLVADALERQHDLGAGDGMGL
ncbi:MAG: hypothetical protein M3R02_11950 [Chloroflexota bacterium]|nr:hypothetical protein [Chloroflexota bacterium]